MDSTTLALAHLGYEDDPICVALSKESTVESCFFLVISWGKSLPMLSLLKPRRCSK
jgi:hypothetical protein